MLRATMIKSGGRPFEVRKAHRRKDGFRGESHRDPLKKHK